MKAIDKLKQAQVKNNSLLCVGLDLDPKRIPQPYGATSKGMFDYARLIIEATSDLVSAYKPNLAFFEALGSDGVSLLQQICRRIPEDIPIILDAKRGDIGNTSAQYATSLFKIFGADWVTVNPYMGHDSIKPFLDYQDRGVFVLCLTSNPGSMDFQTLNCDGQPLYMRVCEKAAQWNTNQNIGLVVGATHPDSLTQIRSCAEDMPLLIPGIGAQGGALEKAVIGGSANFTKTALLNVSRSVLYASKGQDFVEKARESAERIVSKINALRPTNRDDSVAKPVESAPDSNSLSAEERPAEPAT